MTTLDLLRPYAVYPGIYAVLCRPARMVYVGMTSRAMIVRWDEHYTLLKLGRHPNDAMQAAWSTYRAKSFDVAILEIVTDARRLAERERYYIRLMGNANERK